MGKASEWETGIGMPRMLCHVEYFHERWCAAVHALLTSEILTYSGIRESVDVAWRGVSELFVCAS